MVMLSRVDYEEMKRKAKRDERDQYLLQTVQAMLPNLVLPPVSIANTPEFPFEHQIWMGRVHVRVGYFEADQSGLVVTIRRAVRRLVWKYLESPR